MNKIFEGVRIGDYALAALLTALGVVLMLENINAGPGEDIRIDSHSWLLIPVIAATSVPILWRRRNILAVCAVTAAAYAVHVLAFGWVVRCGVGLPLSLALAYSVGRLTDRAQALAGLAAVIGIQFIVLVKDSAAGLAIIPVTALIAAAVWGAGMWVRKRFPSSDADSTSVPVSTYA